MKRLFSFGIIAAALAGCAPTAESVVADAAEALGGEEAVLATNTLVLNGTGTTYRTGQNTSPDAELPQYELHEYRKEIEWDPLESTCRHASLSIL